MKKNLSMILVFFLFLLLVGCRDLSVLPKPEDTNLEFWLAENVEDFSFSEHIERYGCFGCKDYYGLGYTPLMDEYEQQIDPQECVIYTITSYPDYSSRQKCVTRIKITDPNIVFFGLTINSSLEAFDDLFINKGFTNQAKNNPFRQYVKGKVTVRKYEQEVYFIVEVSNKFGIIY